MYRTQPTKAIIGESAAGLFVVETFMLHPEIFDYYIAMDPALWFNEQYLVKNFESLSRGQNYQAKKFWFAGSSAEDISKHTRELESKLKNSQFKFIGSTRMNLKRSIILFFEIPRKRHSFGL